MPVSLQQVQTWMNRGGTSASQSTYASIKDALDRFPWPDGVVRDCYLQGSYRNSTNIRGDSDVDVVVELTSTYYPDTRRLTQVEIDNFNYDRIPAQHQVTEFKGWVEAALRARFGRLVTLGKKCINVGGEGERLNGDVLACATYREYKAYRPYTSYFEKGVQFYVDSEARWIVNYPRQHIDRGEEKNGRTRENYKPMVRAFKNARNYLIAQNLLRDGITPSYFVEGLLSNVPDDLFSEPDDAVRFQNIANALVGWVRLGYLTQCKCQNGIIELFGGSREQWDEGLASEYILALAKVA
jgi:hypothetical protein